MSNSIRKKAHDFCKAYSIKEITKDQAEDILDKLGYTVVEFNYIFNDEAVATLIDKLKLSDEIIRTKGFTYVDNRHRLVFLNDDLNESEQVIVLVHELGHIYCEHFSHCNIIGNDVREEHEANEFAHYVLNPSGMDKLTRMAAAHKKAIIAVTCVIIIIAVAGISFSFVKKQQSYYGEYYITGSGQKYHQKDCIFVKDKDNVHRLTEEEFNSGNYEPCQICLPY